MNGWPEDVRERVRGWGSALERRGIGGCGHHDRLTGHQWKRSRECRDRERVFNAIKALDYRPNTLARSLREQRSRQIGVIVPNIHDPFFANCAQAMTVVAKDHGYSVTMAISDEDADAEYEEAILMLQRNLDGLLVIPAAHGPSRLTGNEFARLPIVTIDRPIPVPSSIAWWSKTRRDRRSPWRT